MPGQSARCGRRRPPRAADPPPEQVARFAEEASTSARRWSAQLCRRPLSGLDKGAPLPLVCVSKATNTTSSPYRRLAASTPPTSGCSVVASLCRGSPRLNDWAEGDRAFTFMAGQEKHKAFCRLLVRLKLRRPSSFLCRALTAWRLETRLFVGLPPELAQPRSAAQKHRLGNHHGHDESPERRGGEAR
eukprot:COSAG04_NODE_52_length_30862_cov_37.882005_5_plen_188_part_00